MFQTCSNSQLLRRVLWINAEQTIGASLKNKNTQPLYIFKRVRVLHLNRLKEWTWLHSFANWSPSVINSWSINHIFEHKFFCSGHLGRLRSVMKVKKSVFWAQNSLPLRILILCVKERGFINQLYIELGEEHAFFFFLLSHLCYSTSTV